ncbi:MAG: hypothetical protein SCALA702_19790 [Melioribacteraceae bacterium]|nr:MAG: hypothetical protein SCALA702_19790 [Melioribacteraceae bacterium]
MKKLLSLLLMLSLAVFFVACGDDDDPVGPEGGTTEAWVGTWLSADADVAPLLAAVFDYDSVRVTMNDDNTIVLESHVRDGNWTTLPGTYTVTKSESGDVHAIAINYTAFEQEGIIEVTSGSPDQLKLEAVQTTPDIGATPRTPATGFGSDATLGTSNIQIYKKQ